MDVILDQKTGFYIRKGVESDKLDVPETKWHYHELDFSNKVCLDIGDYIGSFAKLAINRGAKSVYLYEPEKENFELCQLNCKDIPVFLFNAAVVGDARKTERLYIKKWGKWGHSLYTKGGIGIQIVDCVNINDVVISTKPDVVKINAQTSEYNIFENWTEISGVTQIAVEVHLGTRLYRQVKAPQLLQKLSSWGFTAVKPIKIGQKNWHSVGVYRRD